MKRCDKPFLLNARTESQAPCIGLACYGFFSTVSIVQIGAPLFLLSHCHLTSVPRLRVFCDMLCDVTQIRMHRITYNVIRFYSGPLRVEVITT